MQHNQVLSYGRPLLLPMHKLQWCAAQQCICTAPVALYADIGRLSASQASPHLRCCGLELQQLLIDLLLHCWAVGRQAAVSWLLE
jgi:hypothetical protein